MLATAAPQGIRQRSKLGDIQAISVVFSSTVKPGIRLAQFSFRSVQTFPLLWRLVPLFDYLCTCVCSDVYQRVGFTSLHLATNRRKRVRYASRDYCFSLCLTRCVGERSAMGKI